MKISPHLTTANMVNEPQKSDDVNECKFRTALKPPSTAQLNSKSQKWAHE
jgi:hypothetical protein